MSGKSNSYYSGLKVGEKIFFEAMANSGENAVAQIEKAKITCAEYCSNMKLKKTKKGVELTPSRREFYHGMFDFLTRPKYTGYYDKYL